MKVAGAVFGGLALFGVADVPAFAHPSTQVAGVSRCGYEVTANALRLRSGPGTGYAVLGLLSRNSLVGADRARGGWYRVTVRIRSGRDGLPAGATGWASAAYLRELSCTHLD